MKPDLANLSDDVRLSKNDIASLLELVEKKYEEKIHYLEERIRLLQGELYGRKSEKRYPEDHRQLPIFEQDHAGQGVAEIAVDDTIVVPAHRRKARPQAATREPAACGGHPRPCRRRKSVRLRCAVEPHRAGYMRKARLYPGQGPGAAPYSL
jgi:hypothetical protein